MSSCPTTVALRAVLTALLCAPPAGAQPAPAGSPRDPSNPQASVPALHYRPAFAADRARAEEAPATWRELNERSARVGGWRAYAKQAREPEAPANAVATPPPGARP